ncbi:MAG: dTMP kinase, partial [Dokdonella sp.]
TVLGALRVRLEAVGKRLLVTREPGGTSLGEAVRSIVLDPVHRNTFAESELLLMFAARAQLVREIIAPALAGGAWVLSDRFTDASYAYQGGGRGQPIARIRELEAWAAAGLRPDLTLLLDVPVEQGLARIERRGAPDRIEAESSGFFDRVAATYRERAAEEPQRFRIIDASGSIEEVREEALAALDGYLALIGIPS